MKKYTTNESGDLTEITDEAELFMAMLSDAAIELTHDQFQTVGLINSLVKTIEPSSVCCGFQTAGFVIYYEIDLTWTYSIDGRIINFVSPDGDRLYLEVI